MVPVTSRWSADIKYGSLMPKTIYILVTVINQVLYKSEKFAILKFPPKYPKMKDTSKFQDFSSRAIGLVARPDSPEHTQSPP